MHDFYEKGYNLEEFRFSPVGLTPYTVFKNPELPPIEIYSSKLIEENVIKRVEQSDILKPIKDLVITGLNNRKIIVGYTNPSKFSFLYRKIKKIFGYIQTWALGVYDYHDDIIYIILDDNVNILGNAVFDISNIIVHELCHMAAYHNKKTKIFDSSLQTLLVPFYLNLIGKIISKDKNFSPKKYSEYVNSNIKIFISEFEKYFNKIESKAKNNLEQVEDEAFEFWSNILPKIIPSFDELDGTEIAIEMMKSYDKNYKRKSNTNIDKEILDSYKKIGSIIDVNSLLGQEVIFPSEIIAISNEKGLSPAIANCINKINMGK